MPGHGFHTLESIEALRGVNNPVKIYIHKSASRMIYKALDQLWAIRLQALFYKHFQHVMQLDRLKIEVTILIAEIMHYQYQWSADQYADLATAEEKKQYIIHTVRAIVKTFFIFQRNPVRTFLIRSWIKAETWGLQLSWVQKCTQEIANNKIKTFLWERCAEYRFSLEEAWNIIGHIIWQQILEPARLLNPVQSQIMHKVVPQIANTLFVAWRKRLDEKILTNAQKKRYKETHRVFWNKIKVTGNYLYYQVDEDIFSSASEFTEIHLDYIAHNIITRYMRNASCHRALANYSCNRLFNDLTIREYLQSSRVPENSPFGPQHAGCSHQYE